MSTAADKRWKPATDTRTRSGGAMIAGRYVQMNEGGASGDGVDGGDEAGEQPEWSTNRQQKTKQSTLTFVRTTTTTTKKRSNSTSDNINNNNNKNANDNITKKNQDADELENVAEREDAVLNSSSRVYGAIVIDKEGVQPPSAKRARGADVNERALTSWVHQAFRLVDDDHYECIICGTPRELGDSSTSTRRKHYSSDHKATFSSLVSAAADCKNAAEFTNAAKYAKANGRQLRLGEEIPAPRETQTRYRLAATLMFLRVNSSYSALENIAVQSFFDAQHLQTFSRTTAAKLILDAGRVVKQLHFEQMSANKLLLNFGFDELDIDDSHFLGVTVSFGKLANPAKIHRFPLFVVRCDPNESTGLAFGNRVRDLLEATLPSTATIFTISADNNFKAQCAARTAITERENNVRLTVVPHANDTDSVGHCIAHMYSLIIEASKKECKDIGTAIERIDYVIRLVKNREKILDEWYKHVKDNKRRPVRLGGENRWFFGELGFLFNKNEKALSRRWIMLTMIDGYIAERQAYAAIVALITDIDERRRLPTAFDVQTVIDIRELLNDLRKLERQHENRALPTMALVIENVVQYSERVRRFISSFDDDDNSDHLVKFGKALLAQGESYFKPFLASHSLAARAAFLGGRLPKASVQSSSTIACYDDQSSNSNRFPVLPNKNEIIEAIKNDYVSTFPAVGAQIEQMNSATKIYLGILLEDIAEKFRHQTPEPDKVLDWWQQALANEQLPAAVHHVPYFVHYVAGMLSVFSSTAEPERLFREVGRQHEDRESLTDERLEAEVLVLDYLKSNAVDVASHTALVESIADKVDALRHADALKAKETASKEKADKAAELRRQLAEIENDENDE